MEKEYYVYISSRDSTETFPANSASDFSVLLPERLYFKPLDSWRCGIVELVIPSAPSDPLFLCSNFSQSSIVGEQRLSALRSIVDEHSVPSHMIYVPIRCSELDVIRLFITGHDGQKVSLGSGTTYCTLHFVCNHESASSNHQP